MENSVPLRQSDRHFQDYFDHSIWSLAVHKSTSRIPLIRRCYNCHIDAALSTFERKQCCVNHTIHHDTDLEQHWWRTIDLLRRVGQAGTVLNPDKFQFT